MVGILADMVRTNLKLPLPKVLCSTQTQEVMHADQVHLEMFSPLKHFAHQYPMEEEFYKKYGSSAVDLAISYLNKKVLVGGTSFQKPVERLPFEGKLLV